MQDHDAFGFDNLCSSSRLWTDVEIMDDALTPFIEALRDSYDENVCKYVLKNSLERLLYLRAKHIIHGDIKSDTTNPLTMKTIRSIRLLMLEARPALMRRTATLPNTDTARSGTCSKIDLFNAGTTTVVIDGREGTVAATTATNITCTTSDKPHALDEPVLSNVIDTLGAVATLGLVFRHVPLDSERATCRGYIPPLDGESISSPK